MSHGLYPKETGPDTEPDVIRFCSKCKYYKPHKPMRSRYVFGKWVGDGRCKIGRRLQPRDYVTVEKDSCEHWEAK